ncbi:PH domain-containing protein [Candidatus Dojkabacteria bacterium]|nr:PH domain-containing protein [Candidatus Dojkabacteria bacterium]
MDGINAVLDPGETIIWEGKPKSRLYMLANNFPVLMFGCFWLLFTLIWEATAIGIGTVANIKTVGDSLDAVPQIVSSGFPCFGIPFVLVGIFLVLSPLIGFLSYKNIKYYITNKRVIMASGLIGVDYKFIDFDQIHNISVNVGLMDKTLGGGNTGSISIFSGEFEQSKNGIYAKNDFFLGIENPYEIVRLLKDVSFDIKTDIEYPNKLRPDVNPGYETEYKPDDTDQG